MKKWGRFYEFIPVRSASASDFSSLVQRAQVGDCGVYVPGLLLRFADGKNMYNDYPLGPLRCSPDDVFSRRHRKDD